MEYEKSSYQEAELHADLLQKKAEIITGKKEFTAEDYEEAEKHLDEMVEEYGSLFAVYHAVQYELQLKQLGFQEEFESAFQGLYQDEGFAKIVSDMQADVMKESIRDGKFDATYFLNQSSLATVEVFHHALLKNPSIKQFCQAHQGDERLDKMFEHWKTFNYSANFFETAKQLTAAAGAPPPPPRKDISEVELQSIAETESRYPSLLTAAGAPPPPPPPSYSGELKLKEPEHRMPQKLTVAAEGDPPPSPPPPPDSNPDKIYEYVEPDNLVDVEWENGDSIHFELAETYEDDKGRKRNFYHAFLTYIPEGETEPVTINLSEHVPGKKIIFEGTRGALSGASLPPELRKRFLGWASDTAKDQRDVPYMVALNVAKLQEGPESIDTIFHELWHVYLFGEKQKQLLDKEQAGIMELLTGRKNPPRRKPGEIAGISKYRAEIDKIRDQLKNDYSKPGNMTLRSILSHGGKFTTSNDFYYATSHSPEIARLRSIFHERTAGAIAVREIKRLKIRVPSPRRTRVLEQGSLQSYSINLDDKRYETGLKND